MGCDSDIFFECLVRIIDLNIYVPINVNLEGLAGVGGGGGGKGREFELEAIFWVKCPTPGPSKLVKRGQIPNLSN